MVLDMSKIGKDKYLHFGAMASLSFGITSLTGSPILAIAVCVVLSLGKEVYDSVKPNATGFSLPDLVADMGGIIVGTFIGGLI